MELTPISLPDESQLVYIFNPTKDVFHDTYDVSGKGVPVSFSLNPYEGKKFPKPIADSIAKHIKDKIVGEMRGVITDDIIKEVYRSIYL